MLWTHITLKESKMQEYPTYMHILPSSSSEDPLTLLNSGKTQQTGAPGNLDPILSSVFC